LSEDKYVDVNAPPGRSEKKEKEVEEAKQQAVEAEIEAQTVKKEAQKGVGTKTKCRDSAISQ